MKDLAIDTLTEAHTTRLELYSNETVKAEVLSLHILQVKIAMLVQCSHFLDNSKFNLPVLTHLRFLILYRDT